MRKQRINPRECLMLRHSLIWGIYTSVNVYVANEGNVLTIGMIKSSTECVKKRNIPDNRQSLEKA